MCCEVDLMYDLNHLNGSQFISQIISQIISRILSEIVSHFINLLSRKITKRDKDSRRVTKGACRVKVGRRRGPKGGKSVLGKGIFGRYTLPRTTVGHSGRVCKAPQTQRRQLHSVQGPKDDSCIVYKAPKTTVAQFTRPQRRQLHSFKVPTGSQRRLLHRLEVPKGRPEAPKTTVAQFARPNMMNLNPGTSA